MKKILLGVILLAGLVPATACLIVDNSNNGVCGDGLPDPGEACDDGNLRAGDGCSASCTVEFSTCGDGRKSGTEACDDGNTVNNDGCSSTCAIEVVVCGDGIKAPTEACDDHNVTPGDGCSAACELERTIGVTWKIKTNNIAGACPNGFDTARVVAHLHNSPATTGDIIDLFTCANGSGVTAPLPANTYDVRTEIVNHAGTVIFAQSVPAYIDISTGNVDATFDIHTDRGFFFLNWTLQGASGALTCAQAPEVAKISLDTTPVTPPTLFTCEQQAGYSLATVVGNYTVSIAALNAAQQLLGTPVNFASATIAAPNKITNLGTAMLVIPGH
jgi:cysteine-rich repeat protein